MVKQDLHLRLLKKGKLVQYLRIKLYMDEGRGKGNG